MNSGLKPIEPADIAKLQHIDRSTMIQQLKIFIFDLLQHDFERLCALTYRHDVNEQFFNDALSLPNDDARAEAISILIIEREMLKIETRAKYSKKSQNEINSKATNED